jgi:hypothetical protein
MIYDSQPSRNLREHSNTILVIIVVVSVVMGVVASYENGAFDWRGLLSNLSTELIGGVMTFLLIDRFISRYEDETTLRKSLISKLENRDSGLVQQVVKELQARGWLQDGSLYGWFLQRVNFEGIDLRNAKVHGLGLYRCNLKDARIEDSQLLLLNDLRFSIMPDGARYNGRYCLSGDIHWAKVQHNINFMEATPDEMADYYGVSTADFMQGQKWAFDNLPHLNHEIPPYLKKLAQTWTAQT